jgi:hypothetical protein
MDEQTDSCPVAQLTWAPALDAAPRPVTVLGESGISDEALRRGGSERGASTGDSLEALYEPTEDMGSMKLEQGGAERIASWRCWWYLSARSRGSPWTSQRTRSGWRESDDDTEMGLEE